MTRGQAQAVAFLEKEIVRPCESSYGCELVAQMRGSLDLLQQQNRELQISVIELERLAGTDKLTGAWNRRRLDEAIGNEMDRRRRYGHPLSLLVVDVDLFKRVNDRYGHAAGDQLLVELAAKIRSVLRATDSLTRWGGEEFLVLCPETALATASIFAERLRAAVAGMTFSVAQTITVSIGVAECLPGETWERWFHRADAMLLAGKAAGRNQVRIAPEVPAEADAVNFVHLVWHRAYESGHEEIDRQHRTLFQDVNDLLAAILAGRREDETGAIVDTLLRDVSQHFHDEESAIAAAGYPGAAKHAAIHRTLLDRAGVLIEQFRAGKADVGDLFQFLAHEMVARHLLGADREFFPSLQNRR